MLSPLLFYFWCAFSYSAAGQQQNTANSTAEQILGWQDNPSQRGTLNIVESCLFVIVACTWTVQHLNLPSPDDDAYIVLRRKVKWALFTALFPEFILVHAILEHVMAADALKQIKKLSKQQRDRQRWTLTHVYFVNMGGLRIDTERPVTFFPESTLVNAYQLVALINCNAIHALPKVRLEDIEDRSKTDPFSKGISLIQVVSLVLALITRSIRRLPVSQLEILTVAFAACTITTYVFCWSKPQDVHTPLRIALGPTESERFLAVRDECDLDSLHPERMVKYLLHPRRDWRYSYSIHNGWGRIPNDSFRWSESIVQPLDLITALSAVSTTISQIVLFFQLSLKRISDKET